MLGVGLETDLLGTCNLEVHFFNDIRKVGSPGVHDQDLMELVEEEALCLLVFLVQLLYESHVVESRPQDGRDLMGHPNWVVLVDEIVYQIELELLSDVFGGKLFGCPLERVEQGVKPYHFHSFTLDQVKVFF